MATDYEFVQVNNWQAILLEISHEWAIEQIKSADVLIYQPTTELQCTDGSIFPSSDELIRRYCKPECQKISFSYVFNHGFFPVLNVSPGPDGWITAALLKQKAWSGSRTIIVNHANKIQILRDYNGGSLRFDCARRFAECLAEQSRREEATDIKMVPWILQNYLKQRLFLTQNHLTSAVFVELARHIIARVYNDDWSIPQTGDDNEVGMNGTMPIHQAVVDELGLEYPATDGAHEYYRDLLEKMIDCK